MRSGSFAAPIVPASFAYVVRRRAVGSAFVYKKRRNPSRVTPSRSYMLPLSVFLGLCGGDASPCVNDVHAPPVCLLIGSRGFVVNGFHRLAPLYNAVGVCLFPFILYYAIFAKLSDKSETPRGFLVFLLCLV